MLPLVSYAKVASGTIILPMPTKIGYALAYSSSYGGLKSASPISFALFAPGIQNHMIMSTCHVSQFIGRNLSICEHTPCSIL